MAASASSNQRLFYRFRSSKNLLEFKELERRQIFLATPKSLNDPMEGYKAVSLRGDVVLWENLLRHYLLAMAWAIPQLLITVGPFAEPKISASLTEDDLPTPFRDIYSEICDDFFRKDGPRLILEFLVGLQRPLGREGFLHILSTLNTDAFAAVSSVFGKHHLLPDDNSQLVALNKASDLVAQTVVAMKNAEDDLEGVALAFNHVQRELSTKMLFQMSDAGDGSSGRSVHYLLTRFPQRYVDELIEGLVHPAWRTACFTTACTNASNWAAYGDHHKGVALVFRADYHDNIPFLPLVGATGSSFVKGQESRVTFGRFRGKLEPVSYTRALPEVDFFQSLGNLANGRLDRAWHTGRDGRRSPLVEGILRDKTAWRTAYWENFRKVTTTKLEDWKHEEEYRIVVPDILGLHDESPLVQFEMSSLVGVVFGMKTPEEHKLAIMKQAVAACSAANQKEFGFYNMVFNSKTGCLVRL